MKLVEFSINRPVTTYMMIATILLLGAIAFFRLPVDLMPEMEFPTLTVATTYQGVAPEEMETLITRPIEEAVGALAGVEKIRSSSSEGQSSVRISFTWGTDLNEAASDVRTRLDRLRRILPEDADPPTLFKFDTTQFPIMFLAVASSEMDALALRHLMEEQLQYRLERVPGVAAAEIRGGLRREIHVDMFLEKLRALNISPEEVTNTLRRENLNLPVGPVEEGKYELLLRTQGEFQSVDQIRNVVITARNGIPIYIRDVARVEDSHEEIRQIVRVDDQPGLRLSVRKQAGANTVQVAKAVHEELEKIRQDYSHLTIVATMDSAIFIQRSIANVRDSAISGSVLVILVLFLFLRNINSTLIIGITIPISIIATFALMYFYGFTLNTLSFGGLALGVGMLLDNAIVVLDNVFRFRDEGLPIKSAAIRGTSEVGTAIMASTLTSVAVFVPLVFLTGFSGVMFKQLAYVVSFAQFVSLFVALTIIPLLCTKMLRHREPDAKRHPWAHAVIEWWVGVLDKLDAQYQGILHWSLTHRKTIVAFAGLVVVASLYLGQFVGFELMPETDEGEIRVDAELPSGTRIEVTDQVAQQLLRIIRENVPETLRIMTEIGGGPGGGGGGGRPSSVNTAEFRVQLVDRDNRQRTAQQIATALRPKLNIQPGMIVRTRSAGSNFMQRFSSTGGDRASVLIRGHDLPAATELAKNVKTYMDTTPGLADAQISRREGLPEVLIKVDRDKASVLGLNVSQLAGALQTTVGGTRASMYRDGGDEYNILVRLVKSDRNRLEFIPQIPINTPLGKTLPIGSLVSMEQTQGPVSLEREDQERVITVSGNLANRDLGSVMREVESKTRTLELPRDFSISMGGELEEQEKAFKELMVSLLLAIVLVYMVMAAQFESLRDPLIIMFSIPLASIGIVLALLLTNTTFNIQAFIGTILLAGIVVNNAIVLVDCINQLRREEEMSLREAVELGGRRRLRPILMTTLTTVLGLVPMALGLGEGGEVQAPMARVILGGLTTSTLITLVFIPILYTLVEERAERARTRAGAPESGAAPVPVQQ
jgi:hydrophobic/amphiphilic exporter-1 (mainly G- bacteria), HAE1 family